MQELSLDSLLPTVQQGRQPSTQRTGLRGSGYDKGYSSGQTEYSGGHEIEKKVIPNEGTVGAV